MHSKLPKPDTKVEFTHPTFDTIFESFRPDVATFLKQSPEDLSFIVRIEAQVRGSDIKWNDMAGTLIGAVRNKERELARLFSVNLVHFTGNCGIKAIDHLFFVKTFIKGGKSEKFKDLLKIIESFAYHKTNCGYLIGSDTCTDKYKGQTLQSITDYGENYHVSEPTWNPNYTWSTDHKVAFFHKDLNKVKHENYWAQAKVLELPKEAMNLDGSF